MQLARDRIHEQNPVSNLHKLPNVLSSIRHLRAQMGRWQREQGKDSKCYRSILVLKLNVRLATTSRPAQLLRHSVSMTVAWWLLALLRLQRRMQIPRLVLALVVLFLHAAVTCSRRIQLWLWLWLLTKGRLGLPLSFRIELLLLITCKLFWSTYLLWFGPGVANSRPNSRLHGACSSGCMSNNRMEAELAKRLLFNIKVLWRQSEPIFR